MLELANTLRVINMFLCLLYIPLMHLRIRYVQQDQVLHTIGWFFIVCGIIYGSWHRINQAFSWSLPFVTLGLTITVYTAIRNDYRRRMRDRAANVQT